MTDVAREENHYKNREENDLYFLAVDESDRWVNMIVHEMVCRH